MKGQTPIAKFQAGPVSSAVWENEVDVKGRTVTILKATAQRRYRDKDDKWQSSGSLSRNEIPLAVYCLQKAFEKIIEEQSTQSSDADNTEEIDMHD